jgi:hypothetical protein
MDFNQSGKDLAKLELQSGSKAVAIIKDALISITSEAQQEEFLDSYLNFRINNGEEEKEAKNYRSRVKAILKNWKEDDKRQAIYSHPSKSVQLLAKYARELNKKPKEEGAEESADESVTTETLLSLGDISAELDRLAQHLQHHGKFDAVEKLMTIASEILESELEPATM